MVLLSTKKLDEKFKLAFYKNGISLVEEPMIKTTVIDFIWPEIKYGIIITSSKALEAILNKSKYESLKKFPFFCVGNFTKNKLAKSGFNILEVENSAEELANKITEQYSTRAFNYFCGKQRLNFIENVLKTNNIELLISEVYKTDEISKKVNGDFDGVLFFSPSAVKSYALLNSFESKKIFSWGNTTGKEIAKHTDNYFISKKPEINSLIQMVNKYLKKTDA